MSIGQSRSRRQFVAATMGLPFLLRNRAADAADPNAREWIVPDLLAPARTEGGLTVYSSTNEQEALPVWKVFEDATGIKVTYVRGADASLVGRIAIEARAGQQSWDLLNTPTVNQVPAQFLAPVDLSEAAAIIPSARAPDKRWHGSYGNYNSPAFNTTLLTPAQLPRSYEGFLDHPEWAGKIAIDGTDREWLYAILQARGETEGRKLVREIVARLKPVTLFFGAVGVNPKRRTPTRPGSAPTSCSAARRRPWPPRPDGCRRASMSRPIRPTRSGA